MPWLNQNLYNHYVKTNKPPPSITIDPADAQQISTIDASSEQMGAPVTEVEDEEKNRKEADQWVPPTKIKPKSSPGLSWQKIMLQWHLKR